MQQIFGFWNQLNTRKRLIIVGTTGVTFLLIISIARIAAAPNFLLLYSGLEAGAAGEVVRTLEERGVEFQVRGDSIFVEATQRDSLRMTLASEGLPATGGRGYELLDSLTGFGTTSQMFDAAYWRAKEGELARTIVSSAQILHARVHIANTTSSPFARAVNPTASVSVTSAGGRISAQQAEALRYLVSSAVAGLSVDDVAIIDSNGGVLGASEEVAANVGAADRIQELRERVLRLIEARVGQGNAVVEISVETVTEREEIRERRFDPDGRVAISTDTEERNNSNAGRDGGVTVASNLPDGDAADNSARTSRTNESRERINYEVSETERQILRAPGAIRRITVAVLVNGLSPIEAQDSTPFTPRSDDELTALRELVASAVGFDAERGDMITIKSMEMPPVLAKGTEAPSGFLSSLHLDVMSLAKISILGIVALSLVLFVLRPLFKQTGTTSQVASSPEVVTPRPNPEVLLGELNPASVGAFHDPPTYPQRALNSTHTDDPAERLRQLIDQRRNDTVALLRSWLEDSEERA